MLLHPYISVMDTNTTSIVCSGYNNIELFSVMIFPNASIIYDIVLV